jgi:uncharacterized phage protein (TIGR01671 family)
MREIKFRGKQVDNGEWVEGSLLITVLVGDLEPAHYFICPIKKDGMHRVDPATVGQYTGLKDKNGKEICEGDICNCREYECFGKVEWNNEEAGFYFCVVMEDGGFEEERLYEYADELAVIGNIHDNPELLGGTK